MARIFLDANESRNGALAANDLVFGSTGTETVSINTGATNVRIDGTVEGVALANAPAAYTYLAQGNNLVVFSGGVEVARIIVQDDADGTSLTFPGGSTQVRVGAGGMTIGGTPVPTDTAGTVTPGDLDPNTELATALGTLTASQAALAEFLASTDVDDNPATPTTPVQIEGNLTAAETALATARNTVSDRVLQANLGDAQEQLAAAEAAVNAVPGLAAAVARLQAAEDALDAVNEAGPVAYAEVQAATVRYQVLNPGSLTNTLDFDLTTGEVTGEISDSSGPLIIVENGELVLAEGVTEAENPGVTALLDAANNLVDTVQAGVAAQAEVEEAQAEVDELDVSAGAAAAEAALEADIAADGSDADLAAAVVAAENALEADVTTDGDDAALAQAVIDAQNALDTDIGNNGTDAVLAVALENAQQALNADVTADGSDAALELALANAQTALNADITADGDDAALDQALSDAQNDVQEFTTLVANYYDALNNYRIDPTDTGLQTALVSAYGALAATDPRFDSLNDAAAINAAAAATNVDINAEEIQRGQAVTAAQAEVTERAELRTELADAQAEVTQRANLRADVADAQAAVTERAELRAELADAQAEVTERANLRAELADAEAEVSEREALRADVAAADASNPRLDALEDAQDAVEDAQDAIDDRNELIQNVADAQALADQLEALSGDVDAAFAAIEELGFEAPAFIDQADGNEVATAGNDIFVFTEADGEITGFGSAGEDKIYFGGDFSLVALADDWDATDNTGDAAALEIFWEQDGNDLILYVENETFAGNASSAADISVVRLAGVDAESISFDGGFLSSNTGVVA